MNNVIRQIEKILLATFPEAASQVYIPFHASEFWMLDFVWHDCFAVAEWKEGGQIGIAAGIITLEGTYGTYGSPPNEFFDTAPAATARICQLLMTGGRTHPESWLYENKEALSLVQEGLKQAKLGQFGETPDLDAIAEKFDND